MQKTRPQKTRLGKYAENKTRRKDSPSPNPSPSHSLAQTSENKRELTGTATLARGTLQASTSSVNEISILFQSTSTLPTNRGVRSLTSSLSPCLTLTAIFLPPPAVKTLAVWASVKPKPALSPLSPHLPLRSLTPLLQPRRLLHRYSALAPPSLLFPLPRMLFQPGLHRIGSPPQRT